MSADVKRPNTHSRWPDHAVILAAGLSTRLRPLTADLPKCMVPIAGRPLLTRTIEHLRSYGVVNIVINLHHAPERIVDYLGDGEAFGVKVTYSWEPNILGTAGGTRIAARSFDRPFFVWYGDNLSTIRLDQLWAFHEGIRAEATIALYQRKDTSQSGVAEIEESGRIGRFVEKPKGGEVSGTWVSAGVFVLECSVLKAIPSEGAQDFGAQVLPELVACGRRLYGYRMSGEEKLWWIDTPSDLQTVEAAFSQRATETSGRT